MVGRVIERTLYDSDGQTIRIVKTQECEPFLDALKERSTHYGDGPGKWLGSVPPLLAVNWANECGFPIGTRGWNQYARTKLKSDEWRRLRGA